MTRFNRRPRRHASFVYALGERTLGQRALNALVNRYEQAFAERDRAELHSLRRAIRYALAEFERSQGDGHSQPEWILPVMRANVLACFGRLEEALRAEAKGEEFARSLLATGQDGPGTQHLLAKSKHNLSDHWRRLGRARQAIEAAQEACALWPENDGCVVNLVLALYRDGQPQRCGSILHELMCANDLAEPANIVRAHALFEEELHDMTDVPEVRQLLSRVGAAT